MHNCSLFQTNEAQLFQKHNENQGSSFQSFKPTNSLAPYKFLYCPGRYPIVALSILSVSEECLAFILSFPFLSLCALASLLSRFLPSLLTCSPLPFLVLAYPCFLVAFDMPLLYHLNILCRKLLEWMSVSCLCSCQWSYSCIYNLPVNISR